MTLLQSVHAYTHCLHLKREVNSFSKFKVSGGSLLVCWYWEQSSCSLPRLSRKPWMSIVPGETVKVCRRRLWGWLMNERMEIKRMDLWSNGDTVSVRMSSTPQRYCEPQEVIFPLGRERMRRPSKEELFYYPEWLSLNSIAILQGRKIHRKPP